MKHAATIALLIVLPSLRAQSQIPSPGKDSVVVIAGADYAAGGFHRKMLGNNYRDIWTKPIKVPVLDLHTFAGGITPTKTGGGKQAPNLHFVNSDSAEYVFRFVHKTEVVLPDQYKGTVIYWIFADEGSASHPASAAAADPIMEAAGTLHPHPRLAVMPDDPALGEFRKTFAGALGWIEEFPAAPKKGTAFANANEIVESVDLLEKMNKDPETRIDERGFLTAVLTDLFLGDNDRHPLQWKWARLEKGKESPWMPIPRDRDKVFVSYEGTLINLARIAQPSLVRFAPTYTTPTALFRNAVDFDRRMLASLDKTVWDSTARALQQKFSNSVIDEAVNAMPPEYAASSREIAQKLRSRRDLLPQVADTYYGSLWHYADIHGTDADDRATVTRLSDGSVEVRLQSGKGDPYFVRRFVPAETNEIRLYLHDGNDSAVVTGTPQSSIPVRIIGGNGNNFLVDQSVVGGRRNSTHFYDVGSVTGVKYAKDTAAERKDEDLAINTYFNRRPWLHAYGTLIPPQRDYGTSVKPFVGVRTGRNLGVVTKIGATRYVYGFRDVPYSSATSGMVALSTTGRFAVTLGEDKRFEGSDVHVPVDAGVTQLEQVEFRGFGNDVPDLRGKVYEVKQTQFSFRPAVGYSFNPASEISLGPVVRYTTTDSLAGRFIAAERPYGFPRFGQAGLQLKFHFDTRYLPDTLKPRAVIDINGSGYPSMWDAKSAYEALSGVAVAYITLPVKIRPVLALRAGGKKLFGDFPYFDAAFLGGSQSLRTEERQRYAGDASMYGTTELRVPVAIFPLIVPLDVGLLGFMDIGKVYVDGDSPGGWHKGTGGGFWVGFLDPGTSLNVVFTNNPDKRVVSSFGFAF